MQTITSANKIGYVETTKDAEHGTTCGRRHRRDSNRVVLSFKIGIESERIPSTELFDFVPRREVIS